MNGEISIEEIYTREHAIDDVYLKRVVPVFRPSTETPRPKKQVTHFARNSVAFAMALTLMVTSVGATYGNLGGTGAYFADTETSSVNRFVANLLDFLLSSNAQNVLIGPDETVPVTITFALEPSSKITEYVTTVGNFGGTNPAFCNALMAEVISPPFNYSNPLTLLSGSATTFVGNWSLSLFMPNVTGVLDGDTCTFDLTQHGWNEIVPDNTGYFDDETVSITVTYVDNVDAPPPEPSDIVLNEFLPNPDDSANGLDFGNDASNMPDGEWIELYNKGPVPQNVFGWYMTDASGGLGNTHAVITGANTGSGTTIIPAGGWLVVYMNKPSLNNTGDSIYLYTSTTTSNTLVDSYTYNNPSDGCTLEPTPGGDNVGGPVTGTPGNGQNADCVANQVAPNKSYARIPDGTGAWVDPIPTPGAPNIPDPEPTGEVLGAKSEAAPEEPAPEETPQEPADKSVVDDASPESSEEPTEPPANEIPLVVEAVPVEVAQEPAEEPTPVFEQSQEPTPEPEPMLPPSVSEPEPPEPPPPVSE